MKLPKRLYISVAALLFVAGGVTTFMLTRDNTTKEISVSPVAVVKKDKTTPKVESSTTTAVTQQASAPTPSANPEPTTRTLFEADSSQSYPAAQPVGRPGVFLPTFTPTKEWTYKYDYTCNGSGAFLMQFLGQNNLAVQTLLSFGIVKQQDQESGSKEIQISAYGLPLHLWVANDAGCTWHVSGVEAI
jgi:hypothetical protein